MIHKIQKQAKQQRPYMERASEMMHYAYGVSYLRSTYIFPSPSMQFKSLKAQSRTDRPRLAVKSKYLYVLIFIVLVTYALVYHYYFQASMFFSTSNLPGSPSLRYRGQLTDVIKEILQNELNITSPAIGLQPEQEKKRPPPPRKLRKPSQPYAIPPLVDSLPIYRNISHDQRVFQWKENSTMLFPTSFSSTDLVLGLAFGIDANHLAIFCHSLRHSHSQSTVILFVNTPRLTSLPHYKDIIEKTQIYMIYIPSFRSKVLNAFHPSSIRWILFDRLLNAAIYKQNSIIVKQHDIDQLYVVKSYPKYRTWGSLFEKILVLDVRDTAFQSDPFALLTLRPTSTEATLFPPLILSFIVNSFASVSLNTSYDVYDSRLFDYTFDYSDTIQRSRFELFVFSEDISLPISLCGWNSAWIKDCFTDNILNLVQDNYVLCSGVSMGYFEVMHVYIHYMSLLLRGKRIDINRSQDPNRPDSFHVYNYLNHIDNLQAIDNYQTNGLLVFNADLKNIEHSLALLNEYKAFPKCERNGVDQGMHNVLIYLNLLPVKVLSYSNFPVVNLQSAMNAESVLIEDNTLYSFERSILYSIVHQYDRYQPFQNALVEKYIPWLNLSNPLTEFNENPACRGYDYVEGVDMLRGMCDLSSQRALTLSTCCELCNIMNPVKNTITFDNNPAKVNQTYEESICTGFSFAGGTCFFKNCKYNDSYVAFTNAKDLVAFPFLVEPSGVSVFLKLN